MTTEKKKYQKPKYKYKKLSEKIEFGQHEGLTIEELLDKEPGYFTWALKNIKGFSLSAEIKKVLEEKLSQ